MTDARLINIEKLNPSEFEKEAMPFMMLPTKVIQQISSESPLAAMMWVYLQSLPPTWTPNKFHLMSHFKIGERTYQKYMAYLADVNLVSYTRERNKNGTLGAVRLIVHNGMNFKPVLGSDHTAKICIVDFNHTAKSPHSGSTTPVAKCAHINNINIQNKEKENKKDKPPISPKGDCVDDLFERFYSHYPRKAGRQDAIKAFKKHKPTEEFVDMLIENINQRMSSTAMWKDKEAQYILHASTYLNKSRWTDEIIQDTQPKNKYPTPDERAAEQQKILEREMKARLERQQEVSDTKGGITKLIKGVDLKAMRAQQEAERIELGMSVTEYHEYVIKGKNNGAV